MYKYLKNLAPWRDSNPGSFVLEANAMTTMPRRQGVGYINIYFCQCLLIFFKINSSIQKFSQAGLNFWNILVAFQKHFWSRCRGGTMNLSNIEKVVAFDQHFFGNNM
jgi:hypothetical protein